MKQTVEKRKEIMYSAISNSRIAIMNNLKTIESKYGKEDLILGGSVSIVKEKPEDVFYIMFFLGKGNKIKTIELNITAKIVEITKEGKVTFKDSKGVKSIMQLDTSIVCPNSEEIKKLEKEREELIGRQLALSSKKNKIAKEMINNSSAIIEYNEKIKELED